MMGAIATASQLHEMFSLNRSCPTDDSRNTLCDREESVGCAIQFLK